MEIAESVNGVPIRLTAERWQHIVGNKPYLETHYEAILSTIEQPNFVLRGYDRSLIAVRALARRRFLHVVYKELSRDDGFVITAYLARRYNRDAIVWKQSS